MAAIKIFGAIVGAALVFFGFYLSFAKVEKREVTGGAVALAGFLLFVISLLLLFVPKFFG